MKRRTRVIESLVTGLWTLICVVVLAVVWESWHVLDDAERRIRTWWSRRGHMNGVFQTYAIGAALLLALLSLVACLFGVPAFGAFVASAGLGGVVATWGGTRHDGDEFS